MAGGRATSRRTSRWTPKTVLPAGFLGIRTRARETAGGCPLDRVQAASRAEPGPTGDEGPGRPVHDGRGLRRAPARRRPARRQPYGRRIGLDPRLGGSIAGYPRVFTRIWLAMFGAWPWEDLPVMPPEMIYLPAWFPLNVCTTGPAGRGRRSSRLLLSARCGQSGPLPVQALMSSAVVKPRGESAPGPTRPGVSGLFSTGLEKTPGPARVITGPACDQAPTGASGTKKGRTAAGCADWIIARQER